MGEIEVANVFEKICIKNCLTLETFRYFLQVFWIDVKFQSL